MARTRVVSRYSYRHITQQFHVERYIDFDEIYEGKKVCFSVGGFIWREIGVFADKDKALEYAHCVSKWSDDVPNNRIIAEFQTGVHVTRGKEDV